MMDIAAILFIPGLIVLVGAGMLLFTWTDHYWEERRRKNRWLYTLDEYGPGCDCARHNGGCGSDSGESDTQ